MRGHVSAGSICALYVTSKCRFDFHAEYFSKTNNREHRFTSKNSLLIWLISYSTYVTAIFWTIFLQLLWCCLISTSKFLSSGRTLLVTSSRNTSAFAACMSWRQSAPLWLSRLWSRCESLWAWCFRSFTFKIRSRCTTGLERCWSLAAHWSLLSWRARLVKLCCPRRKRKQSDAQRVYAGRPNKIAKMHQNS